MKHKHEGPSQRLSGPGPPPRDPFDAWLSLARLMLIELPFETLKELRTLARGNRAKPNRSGAGRTRRHDQQRGNRKRP